MALRKFQLADYVSDFFNWIDWLHIILMWFACIYYYLRWDLTSNFEMKLRYPVLFYGPQYEGSAANNATTVTKPAVARMFRTNSQNEYEFLQFLDKISVLGLVNQRYITISGVALVMFLFRILKSMDFQEHMGLVTLTINTAASDLLHFMMLFFFVFCGYSWTGFLLFGHQFEGMSTVANAMMTLFMILMDFAAEHASGDMIPSQPSMHRKTSEVKPFQAVGLDHNHSHFILVENNTYEKGKGFSVCARTRARVLACLSSLPACLSACLPACPTSACTAMYEERQAGEMRFFRACLLLLQTSCPKLAGRASPCEQGRLARNSGLVQVQAPHGVNADFAVLLKPGEQPLRSVVVCSHETLQQNASCSQCSTYTP